MTVSAILLMAGSGLRFKKKHPKQFYRLSGLPVYLHTLKTFIKSELFHEIILCCSDDYIDKVKTETAKYDNVKVVLGGKTRQESSYNAINACSNTCEIVLIHDAVRFFVSVEILKKNIELAKKYKAVNTCIQSSDTIIETPDGKIIKAIPNRKSLMRGQTPQTFSYDLIKSAHKNALNKGITDATDDCQLVLMFSHPIHICKGDDKNIKITTPFDLTLAEQLLKYPTALLHISQKTLKNKIYILVGASGGIGIQIKKLIEDEKGSVIPVSLSNSKYKMDLKDKNSIKAVLSKIHEKYGPADGLINSAGLLHKSALLKLTDDEIDDLIHINFTGVIYCCKFANIKPYGHIINISSSSYSKGRKDHSIYSSTKAALVNFTQALAEERKDLYVNVVIPHRTNTPMRKTHFINEDPRDLLDPKTVAAQIVNLLKSKQSSQSIEVKL